MFLNRGRDRIKVLLFDGSCDTIRSRRLERGTFQLPRVAVGARRAEISAAELKKDRTGLKRHNHGRTRSSAKRARSR